MNKIDMKKWLLHLLVLLLLFSCKGQTTDNKKVIGQVSYYGDTKRMRNDLLPELKYKTFENGLEIF